MSNRIFSLIALGATLGLTAPASAQDSAIHGAKTVGALRYETLGHLTGPADIRRQGGFAALAASGLRFEPAPAADTAASAVTGAGGVGALTLETLGLATSFADVRRQGGASVAGKARWVSAPARP